MDNTGDFYSLNVGSIPARGAIEYSHKEKVKMSDQENSWESVEEFLARGGKVQEIPRGKSGYQEGQTRSAWGAPRRRAPAEAEAATPVKSAAKKAAKKR
jgi:hypothetical protein